MKHDHGAATGEPGAVTSDATLDVIQPFQLELSNLRGRVVRAGPTLDEILCRHAYPEPVARLLAQTITLAITLAAALKYEGIFTLQTKGDGPVKLTVADVTSVGDVRGYAQFDEEALAGWTPPADGKGLVPSLLGKGYLAFTVDQGEHTQRYQGIVELDGDDLDDCVRHYFRQSEQLPTGIEVAVGRDGAGWIGGAVMLQTLPDEDAGSAGAVPSNIEDDWRRAMILMGTVTEAELLDRGLPVNALLFRLFHEEGVRVYRSQAIRPSCRCSRERVATVLRSIDREELDDLRTETGHVAVTCEFCNSTYAFDDKDLDQVYG